MTKRELIDEIALLNPTATPVFLARFEEADLAEYLQHLLWVTQPSPADRPVQTLGASYAPLPAAATQDAPAEPTGPDDADPAAEPLAADDASLAEPVGAVAGGSQESPPPFAKTAPHDPAQTWLF